MTLQIIEPPIVVDASVAVSSLLGDALSVRSLRDWAMHQRLLLAPTVFWIEIANSLVGRHRLSAVEVSGLLTDLRGAGIELADRGFRGLEAAIVLADRHGLSVYDATYLWLAMDVDGELATFDKALIGAARAEDIALAIPA